jgi:transposase
LTEAHRLGDGDWVGSVHERDNGHKFAGQARHGSWPEALKREIVAASSAPGASVSIVARRYDVNSNQVFAWHKRYGDAPNTALASPFVPVVLTPDWVVKAAPTSAAEAIEIELPGGYRVRIGCAVTAASLRLVLDAPERR